MTRVGEFAGAVWTDSLEYGDLGNGVFYTSGNEGSATPVEVEEVG